MRGQVAVVIDVLRWSTVVVTALANGAAWVEAHALPSEASARAGRLGRERTFLGGERGNLPLPGFDAGNSPGEYGSERVRGRGVITTTTNGTQGLIAVQAAREVFVGAFVNLDALVRALARVSGPITLVCAGQAGAEALEDTACAGAIAAALGDRGDDAGTAHALRTWDTAGRDALQALARAPHGIALTAAGFGDDLTVAASHSRYDIVPACDAASAHRIVRLVP
ncbi:MAG: 2-phosphosulfolactate phosphatase [Gemmatimonadetes bacterium]|nr:2-phosphosulfolactate phosphatase [Gemmatimonadota bacterium]